MRAYFDTSDSQTGFDVLSLWHRVKRFSLFGSDSLSMEEPDFKLIVLAPIRLMGGWLSGLLLLPTTQEKGQFTRVGKFEFWDHFASISAMSSSTDIVDDNFFISRTGQGDSTEYTFSVV
jgi:hypothetical protein